MMRDQATDLRNLVRRAARAPASGAPAARLVVLAGGRRGAGVTTLSVNLAVALSDLGVRVVLVDGHLEHPGVATQCGIVQTGGVTDILAARHDIHEVIVRGPGGTQIVPGVGAPDNPFPCDEAAQARLIQQVKALGRHAELVLLDVGPGAAPLARRCWSEADHVLLITAPDDAAVMETYATIKVIDSTKVPVHLVVNRAADARQAHDVLQRIGQSCERFLQRQVTELGHVPDDPQIAVAARQHTAISVLFPEAPMTLALDRLADALQRLLALDVWAAR